MAWDKDEIIIHIVDPDTGDDYTSTITVEVYPTTSAYPTNKVACTQLSSLYRYKPVSDLNEYTHYWIRWTIGATTYYKKLIAKNSEPMTGADPG